MPRYSTLFGVCRTACLATLAGGIAVAAVAAEPVAASFEGDATRGAYLAAIMDCQGCHSGRLEDGRIDPAAHLTGGSLGFEMPGLGVFYPPSLTPDATTGLGGWSDAEVAAAIREGVAPTAVSWRRSCPGTPTAS